MNIKEITKNRVFYSEKLKTTCAKIRMPKKIPKLQSLANFWPPEKGVFRGKIISKNVQI